MSGLARMKTSQLIVILATMGDLRPDIAAELDRRFPIVDAPLPSPPPYSRKRVGGRKGGGARSKTS